MKRLAAAIALSVLVGGLALGLFAIYGEQLSSWALCGDPEATTFNWDEFYPTWRGGTGCDYPDGTRVYGPGLTADDLWWVDLIP